MRRDKDKINMRDNMDCFVKIYKENYYFMYHVAYSILQHQEDAENAVQDAFVTLAETKEKYLRSDNKNIKGLCIIIAKNKALDILRKRKVMSEESLENLVICDTIPQNQPEEAYLIEEEKDWLMKVIAKTPEMSRIVLELRYVYEYNIHEIARILGISRKTAETRLYRAKIKMREIIENEKR